MIADVEIRTGTTKTALGERNFTADIFAFWTNIRTGITKKIIFEVRGYKGHNSKRQIARDTNRDNAHKEKGIKTVRIDMKDLVGKKKQPTPVIEEEINWQLSI